MILHNLHHIATESTVAIRTTGALISEVSDQAMGAPSGTLELRFEDATVLPGFINSHDHLDFNLFPQLGCRQYGNYTEWAAHIHRHYKKEIDEVLKVPEHLRTAWGIYKNLLSGFTTVVNHGKNLAVKEAPVTVLQNSQCLHSMAFEKGIRWKLNNPLRFRRPVNIHTGEGTDPFSSNEIDRLIRWNRLGRPLVGVHGVAMKAEQARRFRAVIWCPASNYFMFNQTADVPALKKVTTLCFGLDSTLTGSWNGWEHFRMAQERTGVSREDLLRMLTQHPADLWQTGGGEIARGKTADLVVIRKQAGNDLFQADPADILLVMHKGRIALYDERLEPQMPAMPLFSSVPVGDTTKYITGDLPGLIRQIRHYLPSLQLPWAAHLQITAL